MNPRSKRPRRFLIIAVVAVLAIIGGVIAPWAYSSYMNPNTSAKDRIQADPPPPLFSDSAIAPVSRQIAQQQSAAHRLMAGWWSSHDTHPSDAAFQAWLERKLPPPPSPAERKKEIQGSKALAASRTDAGVAASTWLEAHGKKDVWKLAVHDQAELVPTKVGDARKNDVDAMLKMTKTVADALGTKYQQSAPYVVDPSLRTDHTVAPGDVCPCSYPSRHAAAGAAARTYLSALMPHRAGDYRWTEAEIAWSRIYMAGHVPSDIEAGAMLGDMIGEYFLVTSGQMPAPTS